MDDIYLRDLIRQTENSQGLEMAEAIRLLQQGDRAKLTQYLEDAQRNIQNEITRSKTDMFQKVYGDMERATSTERSILYYKLRNQDVDRLQGEMYERIKGQADAVLLDKDLAKRQYEINQWTSGDKMDTLFVYQWVFIVFCVGILLMYLSRVGFISSGVSSYIFGLLLIIVVLITINRFQYTKNLRDQREWNRRLFPKYKPVPSPVCNQDVLSGLESSYAEAKKYTQGLQASAQTAASKIGAAGQAAYEQLRG
jgi:hypothetical protein